jgi:phage shock protein PspC (stress-responsive transcriptional regulator)
MNDTDPRSRPAPADPEGPTAAADVADTEAERSGSVDAASGSGPADSSPADSSPADSGSASASRVTPPAHAGPATAYVPSAYAAGPQPAGPPPEATPDAPAPGYAHPRALPPGSGAPGEPARGLSAPLRRSRHDRVLAGVCGGLARNLGVDAVWLRLALVLATVLGFGAGVIIYIACWILMPRDG